MRSYWRLGGVLVVGMLAGCGKGSAPLAGGDTVQGNATFKEVNEKIFQPKCAGCHSAEDPAAGVDLSSAATSAAAAPRIVTAIKRNGPKRMPMGEARLSDAEISLVEAWANGGAKE